MPATLLSFRFPLSEVYDAANHAITCGQWFVPFGRDDLYPRQPALLFATDDGPYLVSNGTERTEDIKPLHAEGHGPGSAVGAFGSDVIDAFPLYEPGTMPDGSSLMDTLRRGLRDGHTHLIIQATTDEGSESVRLSTGC